MNYGKILSRAWEITRNYRALWLFGIVIAVTGAGGGFQIGNRFGGGHDGNPPGDFGRLLPSIPPEMRTLLLFAAVSLVCLVIVLAIAATVAQYVARTSLLLLVDEYEDGVSHSWKEGLRMGWSPTAFRLFLVELAIGLPVGILIAGMILVTLLPMFGLATGKPVIEVLGVLISLVSLLPVVTVILVISVALGMFVPIARRVCVLEGAGVGDSLGGGYRLVKEHLLEVGMMWVVMAGVQIAWALLLAPVALLLVAVGAVVGGVPALVVGLVASQFVGRGAAWVAAGLIGGPLFLLIVAVPLVFVQGLMEVFKSGAWTLAYRELRSTEAE